MMTHNLLYYYMVCIFSQAIQSTTYRSCGICQFSCIFCCCYHRNCSSHSYISRLFYFTREVCILTTVNIVYVNDNVNNILMLLYCRFEKNVFLKKDVDRIGMSDFVNNLTSYGENQYDFQSILGCVL